MVGYWLPPSKRLMPGLLYSVPLIPWQATINPHLHQRLLDSHREVWLRLFWGHWSFLLGPGAHKVLFVPSKSLFPQSCGSSVIKSHGLQSQIRWGCSAPLPNPQVGKYVVGSGTFLTVQEFLKYNCSAVCVSSVQRLYSVANGNLLQEGLCHMLQDPGLLQPEPLSLWQATADPCLHRRCSDTILFQSP